MKKQIAQTSLAAALIFTAALHLHAQGSLTPPPGAPAPVMKSLDQIEARTPLVAGQPGVTFDGDGGINIMQPGSYYLTANLSYTGTTWAVEIQSDNVVLDLNGFTISGKTGIQTGAVRLGGKYLRVRNGFIVGGTTESAGVYTAGGFKSALAGTGAANSVTLSDLTVTGVNPLTGEGAIELPNVNSPSVLVERCQVEISSARGINVPGGDVRDCGAVRCKETAIQGYIVSGSHGESTSSGFGISGNTVTTSSGRSASGIGLSATATVRDSSGISTSGIGLSGLVAENCRGASTSGPGLYSFGTAVNCMGTSTSSMGMDVATASQCIGQTSTGNFGLVASATASFCRGTHSGGGTALSAPIAIGCTSGGGTISSAQKFLGTP